MKVYLRPIDVCVCVSVCVCVRACVRGRVCTCDARYVWCHFQNINMRLPHG